MENQMDRERARAIFKPLSRTFAGTGRGANRRADYRNGFGRSLEPNVSILDGRRLAQLPLRRTAMEAVFVAGVGWRKWFLGIGVWFCRQGVAFA
jgi:hypothetical protein